MQSTQRTHSTKATNIHVVDGAMRRYARQRLLETSVLFEETRRANGGNANDSSANPQQDGQVPIEPPGQNDGQVPIEPPGGGTGQVPIEPPVGPDGQVPIEPPRQ